MRGDSVLLCEANVPPSEIGSYVGSRPDGPTDRAQMMFDFLLNPRAWLALARRDAEPLIEALTTAVRLPEGGQWVSFLRNHDELDLSRLTDEQRGDVFRAFAPRSKCGCTAAASGAGSRRCCMVTAAGSSSRTRCSSRCPAPRRCGTARRSGWERT